MSRKSSTGPRDREWTSSLARASLAAALPIAAEILSSGVSRARDSQRAALVISVASRLAAGGRRDRGLGMATPTPVGQPLPLSISYKGVENISDLKTPR